jgi:choice-of-anchor A domain-containing protein
MKYLAARAVLVILLIFATVALVVACRTGFDEEVAATASFSVEGVDLVGRSVRICGSRTPPADPKYPCVNSLSAADAGPGACPCFDFTAEGHLIDPSTGQLAALEGLCPSSDLGVNAGIDAGAGADWTFTYFLFSDAGCSGEQLNDGAHDVTCFDSRDLAAQAHPNQSVESLNPGPNANPGILCSSPAPSATCAIQAAGVFFVEDRASIRNADDPPDGATGLVLNSGDAGTPLPPGFVGGTVLGVAAKTGSITSVVGVELRNNSTVTGDVVTAGTITRGIMVTVTGTLTAGASVSLPPLPALPAFPAPDAGSVTLNAGQMRAIAPGSYGVVTVQAGNAGQTPTILTMTAGDYFFQTLTISSAPNQAISIIVNAQTRVFVNTGFTFQSPFVNAAGTVVPILLGFAGMDMSGNNVNNPRLTLEASFNGTFLAPNATVRFGTSATAPQFRGSFYAKSIDVQPDKSLVCDPAVAQPLP